MISFVSLPKTVALCFVQSGVTSIIPSCCYKINCYVRNCGYTIRSKCIVPIIWNDCNILPPWTNALCRVRIFHRRARNLDVILETPLWTVWNPDINKGFSIGLFGEEWCLGHNSKPMSCFVSPSLSSCHSSLKVHPSQPHHHRPPWEMSLTQLALTRIRTLGIMTRTVHFLLVYCNMEEAATFW